jgi:hypothetical protein
MYKMLKLYLLFILILFCSCSAHNDDYVNIDVKNINDYSIKDIENIISYDIPDQTIIVALELQYYKSILQGTYLHIKIPVDNIDLFILNFPINERRSELTGGLGGFLNWGGLVREEINIEAYYEETYKSTKYSSLNTGDIILILKPIDGYYDVYMSTDSRKERPTNKPWGKD